MSDKEIDGKTYIQYDADPKVSGIDRANSGWVDPWSTENPYRPGVALYVTVPEIRILDTVPETTVRSPRHIHSMQLDGLPDDEQPESYVIIRPDSLEQYNAICQQLRVTRILNQPKLSDLIARTKASIAWNAKETLVSYAERLNAMLGNLGLPKSFVTDETGQVTFEALLAQDEAAKSLHEAFDPPLFTRDGRVDIFAVAARTGGKFSRRRPTSSGAEDGTIHINPVSHRIMTARTEEELEEIRKELGWSEKKMDGVKEGAVFMLDSTRKLHDTKEE